MGYEKYLLVMCNMGGISFLPTSVATNGTYEITGIKKEFIVTRNGTYIVNTTAADKTTAEIIINITGIEEEKFSIIYSETTTITDVNGATAKIPAGFAVGISNGINTVANGLVITDAVDSNGYSIGNEFIWIPVEDESVLERTEFDSTTGQPITGLDTTTYSEPYASGYSDEAGTEEIAEYNTMKEKVLEHKGFYIGRYESGKNTAEIKKLGTREVEEVVIKKGVAPYNDLPWGDNMATIGTKGAVYLSKNMYVDSNSVVSTLIYASQWDAMCRYIGDANRTTSTKEDVDLTGRIGTDNSKNIYDLAGNCYEWTMEADTNMSRTTRGGAWGVEKTISNRSSMPAYDYGTYYSFRTALYLK